MKLEKEEPESDTQEKLLETSIELSSYLSK